MSDRPNPRAQERLVIGTVAAIGIVTMVFGFLSLRRAIVQPNASSTAGEYKTPQQRQQEVVEALKLTDTDQDGLNDYDELNIYRTNPYLEDTDSDGIDDATEIAQSSNPNCPKGSNCQFVSSSSGNSGSSGCTGSSCPTSGSGGGEADTEIDAQTLAFLNTFGDPTQLTRAQADAILDDMSTSELRDFFTQMGVPQDAVDKADDQTLRQLVSDALDEISFLGDSAESGDASDQ
jgi:hypothetical protein